MRDESNLELIERIFFELVCNVADLEKVKGYLQAENKENFMKLMDRLNKLCLAI